MLMYLVKEMAESLLRNVRKFRVGSKKNSIINALVEDGLAIVPDFIASDKCKILCNKIDKLIESNSTNVWSDDLGSDERIYFVNQKEQCKVHNHCYLS